METPSTGVFTFFKILTIKQTIIFLGLDIDTVPMAISLTCLKKKRLRCRTYVLTYSVYINLLLGKLHIF